MNYNYQVCCVSRTGKVRNNNEDNFLFNGYCLPIENNELAEALTKQNDTEKRQMFALFDGMGGELGGEIAARTAAEVLKEETTQIETVRESLKKFLSSVVHTMSQAVYQKGQAFKLARIGTTVAGISFAQNSFHIYNVGDSRIYRFSSGELEQLSEDDVIYDPNLKNQHLTQFVGLDTQRYSLDAHIPKGTLAHGDLFLLCTDGLYNAVPERDICRLLRKYKKNLKTCAEKLADLAEENGGEDNCTVMLFHFRKNRLPGLWAKRS